MSKIWAHRPRLFWQSNRTTPLGQVSLSGYIRNGRGIPMGRLRNFPSFALVYLLEGSGRMKVGAGPLMPCRAGDILFVYPGVPHAYGPGKGETWSEFYVVFNGPIFEFWRRHGLLNAAHAMQRLAPIRQWLPQLEAVVAAEKSSTADEMLRRVCRLQKFLADIIQMPKSEPALVPWLETAMDELVKSSAVTPEALARRLGLSYETFRKEFTRHAGCPPARFRMRRLIEQAAALMAERHLSNKELAETLGFYDEFHFSRRFHEVMGKSPREYRQSLDRDIH